MRIERCVCTNQPFAELLTRARDEGMSLRQLVEQTGASACCSMCGPYLRRCYRTGQTTFTALLADGDEPPAGEQDRVPAG